MIVSWPTLSVSAVAVGGPGPRLLPFPLLLEIVRGLGIWKYSAAFLVLLLVRDLCH